MLRYKFKLALYDGSAHSANLVYEFKDFCYYMNIPRYESPTNGTVQIDVSYGHDFVTDLKDYLDDPAYISPIWASVRGTVGGNPRWTRPIVHGLFPYSFDATGFNGSLRFIDEDTGYYFVITDDIRGYVEFRDNNGNLIKEVRGIIITGQSYDVRWLAVRGTVDGRITSATTFYRLGLNMNTNTASSQLMDFVIEDTTQTELGNWFSHIEPVNEIPILSRDTDGVLTLPMNIYDNNDNFYSTHAVNIPTYQRQPDNLWTHGGNYGSYISDQYEEVNTLPMAGFSEFPSTEARTQWANLVRGYCSDLLVKTTYYPYNYKLQSDETNYLKGNTNSWNNWGYGLTDNEKRIECYLNNVRIGNTLVSGFLAKNNTSTTQAEIVFPIAQRLRNGIQPYTQVGFGLIQKNCVEPGNTGGATTYANVLPFLYCNNQDYPMGNGVLKAWLVEVLGWGTEAAEETPDPNDDGGTTEPGGGGGNFSDVSDDIDIGTSLIPDTAYGRLTVFRPDTTQFNAIMDKATDTSIIASLDKIFSNDLSQIVTGCFFIPAVPSLTGQKEVQFGNKLLEGVYADYTSTKTVRVNLGSIKIDEYWGSFLDYSPYTKIKIYLPFLGERTLDTDEVMGKTIYLYYDIYVPTGNFIAKIKVEGSVRYQFSGNCACKIPIITEDKNAKPVIGMIGSAVGTAVSLATGNMAGAAIGAAGTLTSAFSVVNGKPDIGKIGDLTGDSGYLGTMTPYLSITRPVQSLAENFKHFNGYPSNIKSKISDLAGYTEIDDINLTNIPATEDIKARLEQKLKGGVYL